MNGRVKIKRENYLLSLLVLAITGIIIFIFSNEVVWQGDDICYGYQFVAAPKGENCVMNPDLQPIRTIGDIFNSQYYHRLQYNGRTVAHTLVQLYCGICGKTLFALSNAIVWILFILTVWKLIILKDKHLIPANKSVDRSEVLTLGNGQGLWTLSGLILIVMSTQMTPSCQIGYIWMTLLMLMFLKYFIQVKSCHPVVCPLLFIFGVIAGNAHEALGIGILGGLIIILLRDRRNGVKSRMIARVVLISGYIVGLSALCFSPAAISRGSTEQVSILESLFNLLHRGLGLYLLSAVLIFGRNRVKSWNLIWRENELYFVIGVISLLFNLAVGIRNGRQLLGINLMSVIISMRIIRKHSFEKYTLEILWILLIYNLGIQWRNIQQSKEYYRAIEKSYSSISPGSDSEWVSAPLPELKSEIGYIMSDLCTHPGWLFGNASDNYFTMNYYRELNRKYPGRPELCIIPTDMEVTDRSGINEIAPGFILLTDKGGEPDADYYRELWIGGLRIPYPFDLPRSSDPTLLLENDTVRLLYFTPLGNNPVKIRPLPTKSGQE